MHIQFCMTFCTIPQQEFIKGLLLSKVYDIFKVYNIHNYNQNPLKRSIPQREGRRGWMGSDQPVNLYEYMHQPWTQTMGWFCQHISAVTLQIISKPLLHSKVIVFHSIISQPHVTFYLLSNHYELVLCSVVINMNKIKTLQSKCV